MTAKSAQWRREVTEILASAARMKAERIALEAELTPLAQRVDDLRAELAGRKRYLELLGVHLLEAMQRGAK